jgi:hypothetical protein
MQSVCYKYNCRIRPFKKLKQASVFIITGRTRKHFYTL